jgi:hypothetical protein
MESPNSYTDMKLPTNYIQLSGKTQIIKFYSVLLYYIRIRYSSLRCIISWIGPFSLSLVKFQVTVFATTNKNQITFYPSLKKRTGSTIYLNA